MSRPPLFICIIMILVLTGCQNYQPIAEATTTEQEPSTEPIQEKEKQKESDTIPELNLHINEKTYTITQKSYPILYRYVSGFENPEKQLNALNYSPLLEDQYLIEFACQNNTCSHIVLDFHLETSFLLNDLSVLKSFDWSTDKRFISFLFERSNNDGVKKHHLAIMDLYTLEPASLELVEDEPLIPLPNQYQYEIKSVKFIDGNQIQIETEDIIKKSSRNVTTTWQYDAP
ncbi:hypothetical protein [Halobacillus yeomjeoni]|uniref:Lipoprotein n=1 Tax=Halobacillus yeomjeoni TaxID=311194 RepID=A0A931HT40_9BACI|nr:hypothetical protein [Halobacillus yeomjeoni]MBH0228903.1 hypothetical protein [Halobacillus yeomjeoni]